MITSIIVWLEFIHCVFDQATDEGNPTRSGSCEVKVSLLDVNDNEPVFYGQPYTASIQENAPAGTEVMDILSTTENKKSIIKLTLRKYSNHFNEIFRVSSDEHFSDI